MRNQSVFAMASAASQRSKYVSVFRIDGKPILPPLMTPEKRRLMQKFKEKAIKLEQEKRHRSNQRVAAGYYDNESEVQSENEAAAAAAVAETPQTPRGQRDSNPCSSNDFYDLAQQEVENSYKILSNLMQKSNVNVIPKKYCNASTCTDPAPPSRSERVYRLQKSETLIYDNRTNAIIMPMDVANLSLKEKQSIFDFIKLMFESNARVEAGEKSADKNSIPQRPNSLLLDKIDSVQIPSICVNPPTPMQETTKATALKEPLRLPIKGPSGKSTPEAHVNFGTIMKTKPHNVPGKSIQFERVNDDSKLSNNEFINKTPSEKLQRSATSPSLKSLNTAEPSNLHISPPSVDGSESGLTRSNSFTLDYPSKVLLDHLQKQQIQRPNKSPNSSPANSSPVNSSTYASIRRETVESKAKRVNKIEVKQRMAPLRVQVKPKTAFNSTTKSGPIMSSISNNNNSVLIKKKNRSPYEGRLSITPNKRQMKKSNSIGKAIPSIAAKCYNKQQVVKFDHFPPTVPAQLQPHLPQAPAATPSAIAPLTLIPSPPIPSLSSPLHPLPETDSNTEVLTDIELMHREKFMKLIAQQHEEQKRLQAQFDSQQKLLLEQICAEMSSSLLSISVCDDVRTSTSECTTDYDYRESLDAAANADSSSLSVHSSPISMTDVRQTLPKRELGGCVANTAGGGGAESSSAGSVKTLSNKTPTPSQAPVMRSTATVPSSRKRLFTRPDGSAFVSADFIVIGEREQSPTVKANAATKSSSANRRPLSISRLKSSR